MTAHVFTALRIAAFSTLALGAFGCWSEPQEAPCCPAGSKGPLTGPTGPRGPQGVSATPLTGYMVHIQAEGLPGIITTAEALCEDGDLMTSGFCSPVDDAKLLPLPALSDDGEPIGWTCSVNEVGAPEVIVNAFVFCAER